MDKDFFVREIERHSGMMYRVAFTILRNDEDCRDAMQETALKAWEKRYGLREERYFATWMTRILINECYTIQRKRKRVLYAADTPEESGPPLDPALSLILRSLPEKLRLPLMLQYAEGMTYDAAYCGGEEMTEAVYGENGEVLCVFMAMTNPETLPEAVNAVLTVRVEECDPATGEPLEGKKWQSREEITIPVHGVTAEKHYTWEDAGRLEGCTLQAVTARQTCAGVYLTVTLTADESADQDRLYDQLVFADENGVPFPGGISFTGKMDTECWPEMTMERMPGIDLPETMKIMNRDTGSEILLK